MTTQEEHHLRDVLKKNQTLRNQRLKPLYLLCAEMLDSQLLKEENNNKSNDNNITNNINYEKYKSGLKNLPDDLKEQLFTNLSVYQLGRLYPLLLGNFVCKLIVDKWSINNYSSFFNCVSSECPQLDSLFIHSLSFFKQDCVDSLRNLLQTVSLKNLTLSELSKGITSEMFDCIMENGKSLERLNVSCQQITDQNIKKLHHCTSLTSLRLVDCHRLGKESLDAIKGCANLRSLMLCSNRKLTNLDMVNFCSLQDGMTQLQDLDLDRIQNFCSVRIHLPKLVSLAVDNSLVNLESFELGCPDLQKLSLKLLVTFGEMIAKEIPALKKLEVFKLREDQFSNVDYTEILRNLARHDTIQAVEIDPMNGYASPALLNSFALPVEKLILQNIGEISDETIAAFTKNLPNLTHLDIQGATLQHPFFDFPNMEVLDSNKIYTIESVKIRCPKLRALDISNCHKLQTVDWHCPELVHIYIAGLDLFTTEEIFKMTGACGQLMKVMMSKLPLVTDDVAVALCTLPNLQILNLSECPLVTPKTMLALYQMFPHISFFQFQ